MVRRMSEDTVARSREEVRTALKDQTKFLARSCKEFDAGDRSETARIATALRVIVNSSSGAQSIIKQLGLVSSRFLDTGNRFNERNLIAHTGLVSFRQTVVSPGMVESSCHPLCTSGFSENQRWVPFPEWWNSLPILTDDARERYTRMTLVGFVANEDNGAHLDPYLTRAYTRLKTGEASGWTVMTSSGAIPLKGIVEATIRQIGHEVLSTLKRIAPNDFFYDAYGMYSAGPDYRQKRA